MNLAYKTIHECDNTNETFIYATLHAIKGQAVPYFDVYTAPHFIFSDGSILEFVVEYDKEVLSCNAFDGVNDLIENSHKWRA